MPRSIPEPPKPAEEMTDAEKATYRAELEAAIDSIKPPVPAGARPGMKVGEGYVQEYVGYTRDWFLDIENRRKDVGTDGKLQWPDYQLHDVMHAGSPSVVKIGGVTFGLLPGRICKLPTPFYHQYKESLAQIQKDAEQWAMPDKPQQFTVYRMPGVWEKLPYE